MKHEHPPIIVISGAIGSGKGTILHALACELKIVWLPTHSTRPYRKDDQTLSRRTYDTETTFQRHQERGDFIGTVQIANHHYGLLKRDLETELNQDKPVILELTVSGGIELSRLYANTLLIFLQTDEKWRRQHINHRNMDKREIDERMAKAKEEERLAKDHYDFLVENIEDYPEEAIEAIKKLIIKKFPTIENA